MDTDVWQERSAFEG